jgi:hypothetical protein
MTDQPIDAAPSARMERLIFRHIEGEWLYYDLDSHKVSCLNAFSARVLKLCDGTRTTCDIVEALRADGVEEYVVHLTLEKLAKAELLDAGYKAPARTAANTSRRDMIRSFGVGVLTIAPAVHTITVPTPAQAASCVGFHGFCTSDSQCCSGNCHPSSNKCM